MSEHFKWYIFHTTSNGENRAKRGIIENFTKKNLSSLFGDIIVPVVEVSQVKRGRDVKHEKKLMPGYILIKMVLNDDSLLVIKSVPQVTSFLGPASDKEVENISNQIKIHEKTSHDRDVYRIGETVSIIDGAFETCNGVIDMIDLNKSKLRVSVSIFGRLTPVDVSFSQVRKIDKI